MNSNRVESYYDLHKMLTGRAIGKEITLSMFRGE
ncbi:MAG: hypothetical protein JRN20_09905 [Nitrososphaerota archaeon]|nr:hypothetical protein [Nitrososphaerota archaeon]